MQDSVPFDPSAFVPRRPFLYVPWQPPAACVLYATLEDGTVVATDIDEWMGTVMLLVFGDERPPLIDGQRVVRARLARIELPTRLDS